ncbi:hypothetical protein [Powai lake megavirus]|uniref:F-box and FNIP repeat-containing protein n=1 Tax=Powai lake megavirus TaxID=1842663 RepID=A0A167RR29_9VIRU|nr:hypothetical protein QJ849_gp945 [Powai lake megavirus]ANB51107.1 hypothetical protein [Powai lake megavirus]
MSRIDNILNIDVILYMTDFLSDKDKVMFFSTNIQYRNLIHYTKFHGQYFCGKIIHLPYFHNFKNISFFPFKKEELLSTNSQIIYRPGSIMFKLSKIDFSLKTGDFDFDSTRNNNQDLFNYFGINDMDKLKIVLLENLHY